MFLMLDQKNIDKWFGIEGMTEEPEREEEVNDDGDKVEDAPSEYETEPSSFGENEGGKIDLDIAAAVGKNRSPWL